MARKPKGAKQNAEEQPPSGIPKEDWANTPISVRKFVTSILETKQEVGKDPKNRFPILITLLINVVIVAVLTNYLEGKVAFPCITPRQVGPLSVAIISSVLLHLIWRNVYAFIPSKFEETIKVGVVTIPLTLLIIFFNEMQIWKLPSRLLGLLFPFLLIAGAFLNFHPNSPFYIPDVLSAIEGFSVQRFDNPLKEGISDGGTLTLTVNEDVFVQAVFRKNAERTCTWSSSMSSQASETGCSIKLDEISRIGRDTLTVFIQSACGTQDIAGLHVIVLPRSGTLAKK